MVTQELLVQKDFIILMMIDHYDCDYVRGCGHVNDHDYVHVHENDYDHESTFWVQLIIYVWILSVIFNEEVVPFVVREV